MPAAIVCVAGVTAIDTRWAGTTVKTDVSVNVPTVAVMVVWPAATVVARPELLTVAIDALEDVHVTPELKSAELPSL